MKLSTVHSEVERRLQFFRSLDRITQRLSSSTLGVNSPVFKECLDRLDECIEYMTSHVSLSFINSLSFQFQFQLKATLFVCNFRETLRNHECTWQNCTTVKAEL